MFVDPLRSAIAILPIATYLAVIGSLSLRKRPFLTNGFCDSLTLGIALTGLMIVGPMELFMPAAAAIKLGWWTWVLMIFFYWLCILMWVMMARPKIVVYNIGKEELRPALGEAIQNLDDGIRWAGDSLNIPQLGVQLHLDSFAPMRCASLISSGQNQSLDGWYQLERRLAESLQKVEVRPNYRAFTLIVVGGILVIVSILNLVEHREAVAQAVRELML